jgi:surfactin synthase thioesterase subunit
MISSTMSMHLPKIRGQLALLDLYFRTLDIRVQASTTMAFGDVGDARELYTEVISREQQYKAAIEQYSTGGGRCYVLENEQGLLRKLVDGHWLFCIWSKAEDAEAINRDEYRSIL